MKATRIVKRAAAWSVSALMLSTVLMGTVACTRDEHKNPADTSNGGTTVTTPVQNGGNNGSGSGTDKPLNPDAGTVNPDSDAGNPPAGTDNGTGGGTESRSHRDDSFRSRFMH